MSNERLAIACPKPGCRGLLNTSWQRGKRHYSPCTACQTQFRYCVRGENCCDPAGAVQEEDGFYQNGATRRNFCKACGKSQKQAK